MSGVKVVDLNSFDGAFGELGLRVGPRTGPQKRSKADKEWYVVRRFLKVALPQSLFSLPLTVQPGMPSEPDFLIEHGAEKALVEITEATDEADQREMTALERSDIPAILLGTLGGRFADGASQLGHAWASDIIEAIKRKSARPSLLTRHRVGTW